MARRPAIRVKSISDKPRKKGSRERYCTSKHFLKNQPAEKYQELEILLNTTGIKSDGITIMRRTKTSLPQLGREEIKRGMVSVNSGFVVAERMM